MAYNKVATLEEAKAYFKSLWQPMEAKCVLSNLQKILNFLQSPAEEICFVNMQEKYLPFYYMIILDEEFLQTTFLTDECKVVANKILKTLECNKNSFTWEVSFSTQIAGIPVIFKKVYTQPHRTHPVERYESPIRLAFKETWINTTLRFIKSSRLILKYPEMPRREAQYLYNGILKLNLEESGPDTLWAPVWEALNVFKLRYEYIVSIYPTNFDYLKFVHFEKVTLRRKSCALEIANSIAPLGINEHKLLGDDNNDDSKNNAKGIHRKDSDLLIPVINHNELVKTLLHMNVTKSGTLVYTLKIEGADMDTKPTTKELQKEMNEISDKDNVTDSSALDGNEAAPSTSINQETNLALTNDELADVNLSFVVQGEGNKLDVQNPLNITTVNEKELDNSKETVADNPTSNQKETICDNEVDISNLDVIENKITDVVDAREIKQEFVCDLLRAIENVSAVEDFKQVKETDVNCDIKTEEVELNNNRDIALLKETAVDNNYKTINKMSDTDINVIDEGEKHSRANETDSSNVNLLSQRTVKSEKQSRPWFPKEENFLPADDTDELDFIIHDRVLKKKLESINFNESSDVYRLLMRKLLRSKFLRKNPPSAKSILNKELKIQRRLENKIRSKRRLIETVPTKFIQTSFSAILDFINDESRATMEMVSLNIHEFNVLRKLHGFTPDVVPTEDIFDESCVDVATKLFNRLSEINAFLEVSWIKPSKIQKQTSTDCSRTRCVMLTKRQFKKPRNVDSSSSRKDKRLEELKNPKSILEKMHLIPPLKTKLCPGSYRVSPVHRSASVSPARPSVSPAGHKVELPKTKSLDVEEDRDKSVRIPTPCTGNLAVAMKTKMLEGLAVPLESDKAMRMMRLMGWNGGALGARGEGLIEPIQPQLHVPRGVGLGHKMFKTTKSNITKLQRKVHDKYMLEKNAEAAKIINNNSESNEDIHNNVPNNNNGKVKVLHKPESFTRHMKLVNKLLETKNDDDVIEIENPYNPKEVASNSTDYNTIKSNDKVKEGSNWLTNEILIQKLSNRSNSNERPKLNIPSNAMEKDRGLVMKDAQEKNREAIKGQEELKGVENNDENSSRWIVADDDKLLLYTRESESRHLSDRIQFLVHLLDLLQSDGKSFTTVRYTKKPSQACVIFIDKMIWSLNQRVELVPPPFLREGIISKICAKEMETHGYVLSYRFKKKLLILVKTNDTAKVDDLIESAWVYNFQFEITHHLYTHSLYRLMPEGAKGMVRSKLYTNRAILDFVKSGDEERVYYYGLTTSEIRIYITMLMSLLNRHMSTYQLGLGNSEHPIFRETLYRMRNCCILYRFDTNESHFTKLQLVKVYLEKRCRVCQLSNDAINLLLPTVKPHDIDEDVLVIDDDDVDIYPNRFKDNKDDTVESDTDLITDKVNDSIKINSDDVFDDDDYIECDEEYLIGEDWLASDENNTTNSKNQSDTSLDLTTDKNIINNLENINPNVDSNIESNNINEALENNTKENVLDQEMSSDFHNWPKRIKRNETNNNFVDANTKWNTAERYESNLQDFPKRKVNNKNAVKEAIEDTTLNTSIDVDIKHDSDITVVSDEEFEEECINLVETDEEEDADILTLDVIEEIEANITEDLKEGNQKDVIATTEVITTLPNDNWPKNILIVHNESKQEIDINSAKCLQSIINDAIEKYRFLPRLKCYGVKSGGILYKCYDYDSYIWLFDHLQCYNILEYKEEIQIKHKIQMKITTYIKIDIEGILKNIERYYENIKTDSWKVVKTKDFEDYCLITIKIDDFSLENIKKENYSLFVGVDKADVSVIYD